ncbi:hypothetical protein ZWY2020_011258 [Hordeum vulgare]|nr:hypothetical protein ZWY2020_011258 [Hordeum vulgare]
MLPAGLDPRPRPPGGAGAADAAALLRQRAAAARRRVLARHRRQDAHHRTTGSPTRRRGTRTPPACGRPSRWSVAARRRRRARQGAAFFCQLWRRARVDLRVPAGSAAPVSSTERMVGPQVRHDGSREEFSPPRRLAVEEIPLIVDDFRKAARNAIDAGFDGVEIHGGNGYLIEQFLKDSANDRDDGYGGSLENRCRFALEVVAAVVKEVGAHRVGIRLSPFMDYMDCHDSDPHALGLHMATKLNDHGILYLHMIEPRMALVDSRRVVPHRAAALQGGLQGTFIANGGYDREEGIRRSPRGTPTSSLWAALPGKPDLPKRKLNAPLNKYNRMTFYISDPVVGYTDYPFLP